MNVKCMYGAALGTAILMTPMVLGAQVSDQNTIPNQAMQDSTQRQQQPGVTRGPSSMATEDSASNTPGMTGQSMKDKMFLRDAAQGSLAEIKLGQLASTKGSADDVKTFGAKMVTDHTALGKDLEPVADAMGIRLPKDMKKEDKAAYEKLAALSGEEFDKEYITMMIKDHGKDLREFRQEAMSTNDTGLRAAVERGTPVIREHMGMVIKMAKDKGIPLPPRPGGERASMPPPPAPQQ